MSSMPSRRTRRPSPKPLSRTPRTRAAWRLSTGEGTAADAAVLWAPRDCSIRVAGGGWQGTAGSWSPMRWGDGGGRAPPRGRMCAHAGRASMELPRGYTAECRRGLQAVGGAP